MDSALEHIHISRLIEADYKRRGVFPMLRVETCERPHAAQLPFMASIDIVKAMKADAEEQYKANASMRKSFRALIQQMDVLIRRPEIEREKRQREAVERQKFKEKAIKSAEGFLDLVRVVLWTDEGYRFDNETLTEVESLIDQLEDIIGVGRIVHLNDDKIPAPVEMPPDCKSNAALQTFLKSATSDLSLVKNESPEGV